MTLIRLRGYAVGYAPVTRANGVVTRVTRQTRACVHERIEKSYVCDLPMRYQRLFLSTHKATRNRVTHVTTPFPRVTAGVTNHLSRNQ